MSDCFRRRPRGESNGGSDEEGGRGEISAADGGKSQKKSRSKRVFGACRNGVSKGKNAVLFSFREFQNFCGRPQFSYSSPSYSYVSSGRRRFRGDLCACACLSKPQVLEDNPSQENSTPDDPEEFKYEHLKSMIEENDFYSKECSTHFDD